MIYTYKENIFGGESVKKILAFLFFVLVSIFFASNCQALEIGRVVSSVGLNIRTGPGTNYKIYDRLGYTDNVTILNSSTIASRSGCLSG